MSQFSIFLVLISIEMNSCVHNARLGVEFSGLVKSNKATPQHNDNCASKSWASTFL